MSTPLLSELLSTGPINQSIKASLSELTKTRGVESDDILQMKSQLDELIKDNRLLKRTLDNVEIKFQQECVKREASEQQIKSIVDRLSAIIDGLEGRLNSLEAENKELKAKVDQNYQRQDRSSHGSRASSAPDRDEYSQLLNRMQGIYEQAAKIEEAAEINKIQSSRRNPHNHRKAQRNEQRLILKWTQQVKRAINSINASRFTHYLPYLHDIENARSAAHAYQLADRLSKVVSRYSGYEDQQIQGHVDDLRRKLKQLARG